jgi:hypothetical protein
MADRKRVRSLEESLAPPPDPEPPSPPEPPAGSGAADPADGTEPKPSPAVTPVDLSASIRRLEARQARWIRQRERWRKRPEAEPAAPSSESGTP